MGINWWWCCNNRTLLFFFFFFLPGYMCVNIFGAWLGRQRHVSWWCTLFSLTDDEIDCLMIMNNGSTPPFAKCFCDWNNHNDDCGSTSMETSNWDCLSNNIYNNQWWWWWWYEHKTTNHTTIVSQQQQPKPTIQDDADGHLIYHTGDILHNRCSWQFYEKKKHNCILFIIYLLFFFSIFSILFIKLC